SLREQAEFEQHLIGIVSHDLRNPLQAITMSVGLLEKRAQLDPADQRALARIGNSAGRAHRMIEDLLDFTRARLGGGIRVFPKASDLHEAARHAVEEAQAAYPGRTVQLTLEGSGEGLWDSERLEQVLSNLIHNAMKYGASD